VQCENSSDCTRRELSLLEKSTNIASCYVDNTLSTMGSVLTSLAATEALAVPVPFIIEGTVLAEAGLFTLAAYLAGEVVADVLTHSVGGTVSMSLNPDGSINCYGFVNTARIRPNAPDFSTLRDLFDRQIMANRESPKAWRKVPTPPLGAHNLPRPHILDNKPLNRNTGTTFDPTSFNQHSVGGVQSDSSLWQNGVRINNPQKIEQNVVSFIRDEGVKSVVIRENSVTDICNETEESTVAALGQNQLTRVTSESGEGFLLRPKSWNGEFAVAISEKTGYIYKYRRVGGELHLTRGRNTTWKPEIPHEGLRTLGDNPLTWGQTQALIEYTHISREVIKNIPLKR